MTDELTPVRCGCGGEAAIRVYESLRLCKQTDYYVQCKECGIATLFKNTESEAVTAWNRAMGAGRDQIAITKGYWRATYDGLYCSVCNYKCETTALPNVCPHCGTSMKCG